MSHDDETRIGGHGRTFQPTAWTQILRVRDGSASTVNDVMEHLVEMYWKPVYFHIRREGHGIEDAKDLTQQFFALFMERGSLLHADPNKGKFRTFLLASVRHFLCDEYDRRHAKKRTPNLDFEQAQPQFHQDSDFEHDWAMVVLDRAFAALKQQTPREARVMEAQRTGKTNYKRLAEEMGTSESNIKVMAHRARKRLRTLILETLKETGSEEGEEVEELNALFRAWSSRGEADRIVSAA
ncbi:MAG: sigma-70 family RNA polymerase sigma factor, partial [Verrucomicrobiota bacterium]